LLFVKLAPQVLAVTIVLLTSVLHYALGKRTRRFRRFEGSLFAVAGVGLVVSVLTTVYDEQVKHEETTRLQHQFASIEGWVQRSLDPLIGGWSFPYVTILGEQVILINEGADRLYEIEGRMWDPDDYKDARTTEEFDVLEARAFHFRIASVPPHSATILPDRFSLPEAPFKALEATIKTTNGSFSERFVRRRVEGTFRVAYRVFKTNRSNSVQLLERSDPDFPRDEQGEPLWMQDEEAPDSPATVSGGQ